MDQPSFRPEIGQALFGQPHQAHEVPEIMEAALAFIRHRLDTVMWNIHQKEYVSPFSNTGNSFKNDVFEAVAYSWGEEEQPYNFAWKDLRISWYKHAGRGMSSNIPVTPQIASDCLVDCLRSLDLMDDASEAVLTEVEEFDAGGAGEESTWTLDGKPIRRADVDVRCVEQQSRPELEPFVSEGEN